MKLNEIRELLLKLSTLLETNGASSHAKTLIHLHNKSFNFEGKNYDHCFIREIMSLYGGMGSFFDIGFGGWGTPLIEQNKELDTLKHALYEKCIELRTSQNNQQQ